MSYKTQVLLNMVIVIPLPELQEKRIVEYVLFNTETLPILG
jgi:hypothetical protein